MGDSEAADVRACLAFYLLIGVRGVRMASGVRLGYPLFFLVLIGYGISCALHARARKNLDRLIAARLATRA